MQLFARYYTPVTPLDGCAIEAPTPHPRGGGVNTNTRGTHTHTHTHTTVTTHMERVQCARHSLYSLSATTHILTLLHYSYSVHVGKRKFRASYLPMITPARQPGCQRHARGTLWHSIPRAPAAVILEYTTPDWARGHNGHRTIVTRKLKSRGKQHYTPARPTHTACSHKIMISWTSTD